MLRFTFAVLLTFVATAVYAEQLVLTVVNHSSQAISGLNTFPVDKNGDFVEDNLGGFHVDVPPGKTGTAELSMTRCGNLLAVVAMADQSELRTVFNGCKSMQLVVTD